VIKVPRKAVCLFYVVALIAPALKAEAQARGQAVDPPWVATLPSVQRVTSEIRGSDAMDTAARQTVVFSQLREFLGNFGRIAGTGRTLSPGEARLVEQYTRAEAAAAAPYEAGPNAARWQQLVTRYERDSNFSEQAIERVAPEFVKLMEQMANDPRMMAQLLQPPAPSQPSNAGRGARGNTAASAGPPAGGLEDLAAALLGTPRNNAPAAPQPQGQRQTQPQPRAAAAPRAVDPSIAKARAANLDTKVFGLQLGDPLQLPFCTRQGAFGLPTAAGPSATEPVCQEGAAKDSLENALSSIINPGNSLRENDPNGTTPIEIYNCPSWMSACRATALLYEGLLVGVEFSTKNHKVQKEAANDLREKYGERGLSATPKTFLPDNRLADPIPFTDLEWTLPGLHVEYKVIPTQNFEDPGYVRIETEQQYQRRLKNAAPAEKQPAAKPRI
jgi:hypothetical protein